MRLRPGDEAGWQAPLAPLAAVLQACALDVAVRKPGNVSRASPGHGMQAQQFIDSAHAAAPALCDSGLRIGPRILGATRASFAAAGCNTNLGIVLLCAPLVAAAQALAGPCGPASGSASGPEASPDADPIAGLGAAMLRAEVERQLAALDIADADAAFAAIALARPGGLGQAEAHDVHQAAQTDLRSAMAAAAPRDRIARQYRDGCAELFDLGLGAWTGSAGLPLAARVQRVWLAWLASEGDTHIVRKHGQALAHTVMTAAQGWHAQLLGGLLPDAQPAWTAWDQELKNARVNPGTSADLTVATLVLAALLGEP